jgi:putative endonuclease
LRAIPEGKAWQSQFMSRQYYVYIMSNDTNTVTYTGVTNDLLAMVDQHKKKTNKGFTSRYNINKLVYFETCEEVESVILREKQIKSWPRKDKVTLISTMNPEWHDLYQDLAKG